MLGQMWIITAVVSQVLINPKIHVQMIHLSSMDFTVYLVQNPNILISKINNARAVLLVNLSIQQQKFVSTQNYFNQNLCRIFHPILIITLVKFPIKNQIHKDNKLLSVLKTNLSPMESNVWAAIFQDTLISNQTNVKSVKKVILSLLLKDNVKKIFLLVQNFTTATW